MAREGVHANYLREQPEQQQEEAVVVVANERQRFVDAGRVLMLWGWGALAAVSTAGRSRPPDASSAVHAFLGLVLWLLGVSLVALVPLARRRFPRTERVGAAVANAVIDCFFPPLN
ncbi:hypothetical protein SETIT_4G263900v2 [Setaria italica]|uniref:Uncharacterized protein n=2 Tax=Setaria TaxID=4554 RepID=A0A368QYV8_SETIT|nr:hypothetical protein SETIT_4G263900v2 [Setaria italica]TKW23183.1 hypothetical protein SEVIR_4G276800v2 [Setaria viridis]